MSIKNNLGRYVLIEDIKRELGEELLKKLIKNGQLKVGKITLIIVERIKNESR